MRNLPRLRWTQFSLRGLFVLTLICAVGFWYFSLPRQPTSHYNFCGLDLYYPAAALEKRADVEKGSFGTLQWQEKKGKFSISQLVNKSFAIRKNGELIGTATIGDEVWITEDGRFVRIDRSK